MKDRPDIIITTYYKTSEKNNTLLTNPSNQFIISALLKTF